MDNLIRRFDATQAGDLMITERGIAYQKDMSRSFKYDKEYFDCYLDYNNSPICKDLHRARKEFVDKYHGKLVLDIGVGSGEFIKSRPKTKGYDINPHAVNWLETYGYYSDQFADFKAFTFWDVIEHVQDPNSYFKHIRKDAYLFTSIPVFKKLERVRLSKHYKPNEHLYYFTEEGFINWMALYGFRLLEKDDFESRLGREDVMSFAFKRDLPDYHYMLGQYIDLHFQKHYGDSANAYIEQITPEVIFLNPKTILDYGCGRSDLVAYFYKDGERELHRYDPGIPQYKEMPGGEFDLVFCCDVMEHILMRDVERIFGELKAKSKNILFTIFLGKARTRLPDGQNAHVTLLTKGEWMRWVEDYFKKAEEIPLGNEKILMLKTW